MIKGCLAIPGGFEEFDLAKKHLMNNFEYHQRILISKGKISALRIAFDQSSEKRSFKKSPWDYVSLAGRYRQKQFKELGVTVINEPVVVDKILLLVIIQKTAADAASLNHWKRPQSKEQMR